MKIRLILITLIVIQTAQLKAQCFEADSTIWLNPWTSCAPKQNPITTYGISHWILYDFSVVRQLSKTWIWNVNDPNKLDQGFNEVNIDYSNDAANWTHWGEMQFPKGQGDAIYGGFEGPNMFGLEARYVLLTSISNHGNLTCYGISNIKFNLLPDSTSYGIPCDKVNDITVLNVSTTEALISWEYDGDRNDSTYVILYRILGQDTWSIEEVHDTIILLSGLEMETTYEFVVIAYCGINSVPSDIRQFTTEGAFVSTEQNEINPLHILVAPNPFTDFISIKYTSSINDQMNISIVNIESRILYTDRTSIQEGVNKIDIYLKKIPTGIYFLKMSFDNNESYVVIKVIKLTK